MKPPTVAARECAYWLKTCLDLGWRKTDLDWLEALWWKYHDAHGQFMDTQPDAMVGA